MKKKSFPGDSNELFENYNLNNQKIDYIKQNHPEYNCYTLQAKGITRLEAIKNLENYYKTLKEYNKNKI